MSCQDQKSSLKALRRKILDTKASGRSFLTNSMQFNHSAVQKILYKLSKFETTLSRTGCPTKFSPRAEWKMPQKSLILLSHWSNLCERINPCYPIWVLNSVHDLGFTQVRHCFALVWKGGIKWVPLPSIVNWPSLELVVLYGLKFPESLLQILHLMQKHCSGTCT